MKLTSVTVCSDERDEAANTRFRGMLPDETEDEGLEDEEEPVS